MESLIFKSAKTRGMATQREKLAGAFFFIAVTQFVIGLFVAEGLYSGYSLSQNYVSDLGIGPSSAIFNSSVFVLGLLILFGTYLLKNISELKTVNKLLLLMAISAMGVGIFTKNFTLAHGVVASMAFFFSGLAAMNSARILEKPFSLISFVLGVITLVALGLFSAGMVTSGSLTGDIAYDSSFYLGLGAGGMERLVIYPVLMWLAGFSGWLATR